MVLSVTLFGSFFGLTALDFQSWLVIVMFLLLAPSVIYVFEKTFEKIWQLLDAKVFGRKKRVR